MSSRALSWGSLQPTLTAELQALERQPLDVQATTLVTLLHPAFGCFDTYMEVHERSEALAKEVSSNIQVVPFHPEALFDDDDDEGRDDEATRRDSPPVDAAQYVTRSPVPLLHLLRTSDVDKAERAWTGPSIQESNADRLRGMGVAAVSGLLTRFRRMATVR
jgi:hypothetical protein